jgi:dsRNA-specific ribonuclease
MRIMNNRRFSAEANGTSKKKAKQAAAEAFLYSIIYKFIEESLPAEQPLLQSMMSSTSEQMIPSSRNFIGLLQDFCHRWEIPQPIYSLAMEIGEPQVSFSCKLHERKTIGSSENNENAKQIAAEKMWNELQNEMQKESSKN